MTPWECEFASEVSDAVLQARWPERTDADLVAHVAGCAICSDIVIIAGAFEESRDEISVPAGLPDSGRVWWLAQRRARLEDAEIANRPIKTAQVIALVCAVVLLCAYFGAIATRFLAAIGRIASGSGNRDIAARLAAATRLLAEHAGLALAMGAVLLLLPAAAYLAMGRE